MVSVIKMLSWNGFDLFGSIERITEIVLIQCQQIEKLAVIFTNTIVSTADRIGNWSKWWNSLELVYLG